MKLCLRSFAQGGERGETSGRPDDTGSGSILVWMRRSTSKSPPSASPPSLCIDHETEVSVIHGPVSSQRRRVTREILSSHSARKYRMQMRRRLIHEIDPTRLTVIDARLIRNERFLRPRQPPPTPIINANHPTRGKPDGLKAV